MTIKRKTDGKGRGGEFISLSQEWSRERCWSSLFASDNEDGEKKRKYDIRRAYKAIRDQTNTGNRVSELNGGPQTYVLTELRL